MDIMEVSIFMNSHFNFGNLHLSYKNVFAELYWYVLLNQNLSLCTGAKLTCPLFNGRVMIWWSRTERATSKLYVVVVLSEKVEIMFMV